MEIAPSRPIEGGAQTTKAYPKTRPIPIYSIEQAMQVIKDYKQVLADIVFETIDLLIGSGWILEQINIMFTSMLCSA